MTILKVMIHLVTFWSHNMALVKNLRTNVKDRLCRTLIVLSGESI